MLTQHTKIKQLDTYSKKSSSNNDLLLNERLITIEFENSTFKESVIPQFIEFYIQGLIYKNFKRCDFLTITNPDNSTFQIESDSDNLYQLLLNSLNSMSIQPSHIVDWVRNFKSLQVIYKQTGATETVGILLEDKTVFAIECLSFESAFTKLIGGLLKKQTSFYPILFVSHRLTKRDLFLFDDLLKPEIIFCQSAMTAQAVDFLAKQNITTFGFCRKNKFNRYTNFHL